MRRVLLAGCLLLWLGAMGPAGAAQSLLAQAAMDISGKGSFGEPVPGQAVTVVVHLELWCPNVAYWMDETTIGIDPHPAEGVTIDVIDQVTFPAWWCAADTIVERDVNVTFHFSSNLTPGTEVLSEVFFDDVTESPAHGPVSSVKLSYGPRLQAVSADTTPTVASAKETSALVAGATILALTAVAGLARRRD